LFKLLPENRTTEEINMVEFEIQVRAIDASSKVKNGKNKR
jgi:hypothetical protein